MLGAWGAGGKSVLSIFFVRLFIGDLPPWSFLYEYSSLQRDTTLYFVLIVAQHVRSRALQGSSRRLQHGWYTSLLAYFFSPAMYLRFAGLSVVICRTLFVGMA